MYFRLGNPLNPVLEDPIATWNKLKQNFARKSEMRQAAGEMEHVETETLDETIE